LSERKHRLERLVLKVRDGWLRYSESFTDGAMLLVAADRMGLEGIVSKKRQSCHSDPDRCPTGSR